MHLRNRPTAPIRVSDCHFTRPQPRELDPLLSSAAEVVHEPGAVEYYGRIAEKGTVRDQRAVCVGPFRKSAGAAQVLGNVVRGLPDKAAAVETVVWPRVVVVVVLEEEKGGRVDHLARQWSHGAPHCGKDAVAVIVAVAGSGECRG